jgi:IS30 family transposase
LFEYDFSPEQIAGRIKQELGYLPSWHVSHETIYKYLYDQIQRGLTTNKHFRHGHKARKRRRANKDGRGSIPGRRFINERPQIADMKLRRGDWEGDTIEGAQKKGYVATFVDRKTKYLIAFRLFHKSAQAMEEGILKAFSLIPTSLVRTITVDNGKEFASHENIAKQLRTKIYFAHPYHSWERGLNEHTNGLLRQYLPKNMSLDQLSDKQLAKIVDRINNRPRKSLGYRTPREAFLNLPLALQI